MQLLERWQGRFGHPTGSTLGFFRASTGIGGVIPLLFLNWLGDAFGRRWPTVVGGIFIIIGALIQNFAHNLMTFIGGKLVLGAGVTFGVREINSDWQWKIPTLLQMASSAYHLVLIFFSPESPRWLVAKGCDDEAYQSLPKWHAMVT
ncbi:hypothetical protein ACHAQH_007477 [Verticillium albo-atrum]